MKKILLLIISLILLLIFWPIALVTCIVMLFIKDSRERYKQFDKYCYALAYGIDILGNILCSQLFNVILIKHGGITFGFPGETISSVLGKNLKLNTLTGAGKLLVKFLDMFEENHCIISIQDIGDDEYGV